jgi:hypothetical protein
LQALDPDIKVKPPDIKTKQDVCGKTDETWNETWNLKTENETESKVTVDEHGVEMVLNFKTELNIFTERKYTISEKGELIIISLEDWTGNTINIRLPGSVNGRTLVDVEANQTKWPNYVIEPDKVFFEPVGVSGEMMLSLTATYRAG